MFEDFPPEIRDNRQILWPYYQAAKSMDKFQSVSLTMDKLFLNHKLFTVKNLHEIPECLKPEQRAVRSNEDAVVFYTKFAVFSNFHALPVKVEGQTYCCNEQYFQHAKAIFFNDFATAEKIMAESDPLKMSDLGKSVKGFKREIWEKEKAYAVLTRVNTSKYNQNEAAKMALLQTGDKQLGEGSPDMFYGTGVHIFAKDALDYETAWKGENIMGRILTEIRAAFKGSDNSGDESDAEKDAEEGDEE